ncbi:MAG: phosphomannose isomerase type II C-terminal cupin domain [Elusimicrobia bacterium]|nr:phosphomannose isomerase type II C-terminal cupin domain [Elusimicrobiota bacterium]
MATEKLKDERPWGTWEILAVDPAYKIKRIVVRPGQRLSYQKHAKRREIWTAAAGQGLVTLDGAQLLLKAGDTVDVPVGAAHRVANPGKTDFVFLEVQLGSYFGEDDIVRLEDDYGRA